MFWIYSNISISLSWRNCTLTKTLQNVCNLFVNPYTLLLQQSPTYLLAGWCSATPGSRTLATSPTVPYHFKAFITFEDDFVLELSPVRCRHRPKLWVGKFRACFEDKQIFLPTNSALSMKYSVKIHAVQIKTSIVFLDPIINHLKNDIMHVNAAFGAFNQVKYGCALAENGERLVEGSSYIYT